MNKKLPPPHFEKMKPVIPGICDNYGIRRPSFHLPLIKHDFAEQLIRAYSHCEIQVNIY